ncbi:hypothetical protein GCM10025865_03170 [Paraoerskovia sediminicola]|uniref:Uncharacterized protein n=1 Tax=Paraoerskovia sediminicola TaxID=1138587 RepID=A0ABN6XC22_9CELL|nr:hypothetical protein GCM10025865_03170 [Paraoerskovia sediminicola]
MRGRAEEIPWVADVMETGVVMTAAAVTVAAVHVAPSKFFIAAPTSSRLDRAPLGAPSASPDDTTLDPPAHPDN